MNDINGKFKLTPPNKVWIKIVGFVDEVQVTDVLGQAIAATTSLPYILLEADATEMEGQTPEARSATVKLFNKLPPFACAVVTKTFAQRVIGKLVLQAAKLLSVEQGSLKASDIFTDTGTANQWLQAQSKHFDDNGHYKQ